MDLEAAEHALSDGEAAVVVVAQPNFLGLLEPVSELVELAHAAGALALVVAPIWSPPTASSWGFRLSSADRPWDFWPVAASWSGGFPAGWSA